MSVVRRVKTRFAAADSVRGVLVGSSTGVVGRLFRRVVGSSLVIVRPVRARLQQLGFRFIVPDPDRWAFVIHQGQGWSGNLRAIADELASDASVRIVVLDRNRQGHGRQWVGWDRSRRSWTGGIGPGYLRAGKVFLTHGSCGPPLMFRRSDPRREYYMVWHGVGFKDVNTRHGEQRAPEREVRDRYQRVFAASELDAEHLRVRFRLPATMVDVTGYPRIDHLTATDGQLPRDLLSQALRMRHESGHRPLILYAPTYEPLVDGRCDLGSTLTRIIEACPSNATVGVRLHPNSPDSSRKAVAATDVLDLCGERYPSAEMVLRESAALVTDFSSIWSDYSVLGRPIIGLMGNLAHYLASGRLQSEAVDEFPGRWCSDAEELRDALEAAIDGHGATKPAPNQFHGRIRGNAARVIRHVR